MMNELQESIASLCRRFRVSSLYAFASRAKEAAARVRGERVSGGPMESDLDIAVQPAAGALLDPEDRVRLMQALEDLFEVPRVDLVILPRADAFLAADAVRGELLYCDDEDLQAREELYYLRRAADLAGFEKARLQGILSGELRR